MKAIVDRDACIGCGACEGTYPSVFQIDDENISKVISNDIKDEALLDEAIDSCPTGAISKEE
mgnify:FL=1